MSGFYVEDIKLLEDETNKYGLRLNYHTEKDNWAGVKFTKDI